LTAQMSIPCRPHNPSAASFAVEHFHRLSDNPEGWARFLASILQPDPSALVLVIGAHDLDPDAALDVLMRVLCFVSAELVTIFPPNKPTEWLTREIRGVCGPGYLLAICRHDTRAVWHCFPKTNLREYFRELMASTRAFAPELVKVRMEQIENVDRIRFLFIAITDFLRLEACPVALIRDFGFTIPAAFHIAKGSLARLVKIAPAGIPPELFARFWTTTIGDFHLPTSQIELVRQRFEKRRQKTEDGAALSQLIAIQHGLSESLDQQQTTIQNVRKRLRRQRWFRDRSVYPAFVKHCLVPRLLFSEIDSIFCAHFVFTVCHFCDCELEHLNEEVVRCLHFLVFSATAGESRGIGIFLAKLLKFSEGRAEENRLHAEITRKMLLLLGRCEEFALSDALTVLDKMVKYYPSNNEHVAVIDTRLDEMAVCCRFDFVCCCGISRNRSISAWSCATPHQWDIQWTTIWTQKVDNGSG
jgi:hypothetical protein